MRYVYYDAAQQRVTITPEPSRELGQQIGHVTEEVFAKVKTTFLVQSLFYRNKIDQTGVTIHVVPLTPPPA